MKQIVSHAVGVVIFRITSDCKVEIANHTYLKGGRISIRLPMGTGEEGEDMFNTLYRETVEEIAKDPHQFSMKPLSTAPVAATLHPDQSSRQGELHLKAFYAIEVEGELRDVPMQDGDETLGPIVWTEAEKLLRHGREGTKFFFTHRIAVLKTLDRMAVLPEIWQEYGDFLSGNASGLSKTHDLTPDESIAIKEYQTKLQKL